MHEKTIELSDPDTRRVEVEATESGITLRDAHNSWRLTDLTDAEALEIADALRAAVAWRAKQLQEYEKYNQHLESQGDDGVIVF